MNTSDIRAAAFRIAATLAVLCASSARAIRDSAVLAEGTDFTLVHCKSDHSTNLLNNAALLFDGDPTNGVVMPGDGEYLVADFHVDTSKNRMYVKEIAVGHGAAAREYSLYTSEDGSAWTAVSGAERVRTSGTTTYPVARRVKQVKYVAERGSTVNTLGELEIKGFVSTIPKIVSAEELASSHDADGTANNPWGGGSGIGWLFDGKPRNGTYTPRGGNGMYILLDLSGLPEFPDGCFVTSIMVGQVTTAFHYSLEWSMDNAAWTGVEEATNVSHDDAVFYNVNKTAKYVRLVLVQSGGWSANIAEFQVWAMDPEDTCEHPSYTGWTHVEGTGSCLEPGDEERFCTACGERFTRRQALPFGHAFVSALAQKGRCTPRRDYPTNRWFGTGSISCSRCDFRLDFPRPLDLVTNRVDGRQIGRVAVPGQVNFTDLSVTTTGNGADEPDPNANWGVSPTALYDNNWTFAWQKHWYSAKNRDPDPHADYVFGTPVDLTEIELSVPNAAHTNLFYSVDDATGEETRITGFRIERTDEESGDQWHLYRPDGVPPAPLVYDALEEYDELVVLRDDGIPAYRTNPDGTHPMHQRVVNDVLQWEDDEQTVPVMDPDGNDNNQYQRFSVRFFETPVRHLRVRQEGLGGLMKIAELRPWGTVVGAGDLHVRKETLLLLR